MPRRELAVTARLLAAAVVLSGAPAASAAGARRHEAQEAPVQGFERDADTTRRRAKELTDSLKIRGKFPFLELLGFRANHEGDADKAQEAFAGMVEAAPDNPRGFFHLASNLFIGGNYAGAARLYGAAAERTKDAEGRADALAWQAEALLSLGETDAALAVTEDGMRYDRSSARLSLIRTRALLSAHRPREAAEAYSLLCKMRPLRKTSPEDDGICTAFGRLGITIDACRS